MIKQLLGLIIGIMLSSTAIFAATVCLFYVLNKDYDTLALYVISVAVALVLYFYYFYEKYLWDKAYHAFNHDDYDTAFTITEKLANKNQHQAQYQLALMYRNGLGTAQNDDKFWYWLEKAASQNPDAQLLYASSSVQIQPYSLAKLEVARRYLNLCVQQQDYPRRREALTLLVQIEDKIEDLLTMGK